MEPETKHSGFVALVGKPNVGKSTLVNQLLGEKVAIVSPKPQTTRTRIHAIINAPQGQMVLVDTPGLASERSALTRWMRQVTGRAVSSADLGLAVVEVRPQHPAQLDAADQEVLEQACRNHAQVVVAINKVDAIKQKHLLLPWIETYADSGRVATIVPISAKTGDGLERLLQELWQRLPVGPPLFPPDLHTDQAERFLCAELVREQLLLQTRHEVPHSAVVRIDLFEDERDESRASGGLCRLEGRIYVERDSQKAIVVGRGGERIKRISASARQQMETLLGAKVYLRLSVHVDKNWTHHESRLREHGLSEEEAG